MVSLRNGPFCHKLLWAIFQICTAHSHTTLFNLWIYALLSVSFTWIFLLILNSEILRTGIMFYVWDFRTHSEDHLLLQWFLLSNCLIHNRRLHALVDIFFFTCFFIRKTDIGLGILNSFITKLNFFKGGTCLDFQICVNFSRSYSWNRVWFCCRLRYQFLIF